ncbi:MAG: coenzyme F420-0:L-glutamate ligase [Porticoccaceae bacterium]
MELIALPGIPRVVPGADLAALVLDGLARADTALQVGDILVLAQKIVSKAENRYVELAGITPSVRAREIAAVVEKDPRLIEVILGESRAVLRQVPGVVIVEHRLGFVMANAGVDASNIEHAGESVERVLLLPRDPDGTAAALAVALKARTGVAVGVVINDSVGRAWRNGTVGIALGSAGFPALYDRRGERDLFGRVLQVTEVALADQLAAAASLVQGEADEGRPVVLVRGFSRPPGAPDNNARALLRPRARDLFR